MLAENWDKLTPDERFEARFDVWRDPDIEFASDVVKADYQERVQMFKDAIQLKKPSRPPIAPWIALFPGLDAGLTARETYYDFDKLYDAWIRFHDIYRPDVLAFTINIAPVKVYDALDYNLYDWPGHGVGEDSGYQYNEAEYMKADEYDKLIADPSNYWQRFYLPRVVGAMQPWTTLDPFTDLVEGPMVGPFFIPFGTPPVQEMFKKMMEAGTAALEWIQAMTRMDGDSMAKFGIPGFAGGATKAPYDILGDTMRGTRGLMLDKFRRPEKSSRPASGSCRWPSTGASVPATSTSTRWCSSRCTRVPTGSSPTRTSAPSTGRAQEGAAGPHRAGHRAALLRGGRLQRAA